MKALVLYAFGEPLRRATNRDHLYAFARHSRLETAYVNLAVRPIPRHLLREDFDLVVLHTTALAGLRWPPRPPAWLLRRLEPVRAMRAVKVAQPQDDFLRSGPVGELLAHLEVDHVFTPVPESEWEKIYPALDRTRTQLHLGLTGYLEDDEVARMERITAETSERPLDIGYRAWHAPPWLGRHGALKTEIARVFAERGPAHGLKVDISTDDAATKFGDDWTRFMAECRYTVGVEGGASINDHDGTVRACSDRFLAGRPDASFEEVEAACFPGRDGELDLRALSPRHLEACVTRTCQVLVEGDYNGALRAGEHFIALKADFSNLEEVLATMARDDARAEIVEAAHRDVVASGAWTYASYVRRIEEIALGPEPAGARAAAGERPTPTAFTRRAQRGDRLSWRLVDVRTKVLLPAWLWLLGRPLTQRVVRLARSRGLLAP